MNEINIRMQQNNLYLMLMCFKLFILKALKGC